MPEQKEMAKVRIALVTLGHIPADLDLKVVREWSSDVFEVVGPHATYAVSRDADGPNWEFTDSVLAELLPESFDGDFLFAIASVPLQNNYYSRRLTHNRAVVTLREIGDYLRAQDIPLKNGVLRLLYSAVMVYKRFGSGIPPTETNELFTHDETRGCIFDMNGYKSDLVASCDQPQICESCVQELARQKVPAEVINTVRKELARIRKPLYFRLTAGIRAHPLLALSISMLAALLVGILSSLVASYIYNSTVY